MAAVILILLTLGIGSVTPPPPLPPAPSVIADPPCADAAPCPVVALASNAEVL